MAETVSRQGDRASGRTNPAWFIERQFWLRDVTPKAGTIPIALASEIMSVGTSTSSDVVLSDAGVSPMHARLERRNGRLMLVDLKGSGGSFVNDVPAVRAELKDGDRVRFGSREFVVSARSAVAWWRVTRVVAIPLLLAGVVGVFGWWLGRKAEEHAREAKLEEVQQSAAASLQSGIEDFNAARYDLACGRFRYAADLLLLSGTSRPGASIDHPNELFQAVVHRLPEADRGFDFEAVFDSASASAGRFELAHLPDSVFVYREIQRIAVEVGQSENVPKGFADKVWQYVQESQRHPAAFKAKLRRSITIQPKVEAILKTSGLPDVFAYVPWVESGLDLTIESDKGAKGLWQLMAGTAREKNLIVEPGLDQRTDAVLSTHAAVSYISDLIVTFGREQFMCALASYNRGDAGVRKAMKRIPQSLTMMPSSEKYWYLVDHGLLPAQTSDYVPRIFANRIMAEAPARFGFTS